MKETAGVLDYRRVFVMTTEELNAHEARIRRGKELQMKIGALSKIGMVFESNHDLANAVNKHWRAGDRAWSFIEVEEMLKRWVESGATNEMNRLEKEFNAL